MKKALFSILIPQCLQYLAKKNENQVVMEPKQLTILNQCNDYLNENSKSKYNPDKSLNKFS